MVKVAFCFLKLSFLKKLLIKLFIFSSKKKTTEIKYTVANNSQRAKEPEKVTVGSAGHDLFAAEQNLIQLGTVALVTLEFNLELPEEFFGKIYSRSGLLKRNFVSCDSGLIHASRNL